MSMSKMKKLSLAIAAMGVVGALAMPAHAVTKEQLRIINQLIAAKDVEGLRAFVQANPNITAEQTPVSKALKEFVSKPAQRSVFSSLGFTNPVPAEVRQTMEAAKNDSSLY